MDTDGRKYQVRLLGEQKPKSWCEDRIQTVSFDPERNLSSLLWDVGLLTVVSQGHQINTWTGPGRKMKTKVCTGRKMFPKPLEWPPIRNRHSRAWPVSARRLWSAEVGTGGQESPPLRKPSRSRGPCLFLLQCSEFYCDWLPETFLNFYCILGAMGSIDFVSLFLLSQNLLRLKGYSLK